LRPPPIDAGRRAGEFEKECYVLQPPSAMRDVEESPRARARATGQTLAAGGFFAIGGEAAEGESKWLNYR